MEREVKEGAQRILRQRRGSFDMWPKDGNEGREEEADDITKSNVC
jgi:hypothetical protein